MRKVARSHREVSGAHGEVGARAGTCRSPGASGSLRSATPPARTAGIRPPRAAPRPPRRRRGEPGGRPRSVCPSVCPAERARAQRGAAGGAGRGWPLSYRPLGPSSSRHLASALSQRSPGRGRGAEPPAAVGSGEPATRQADRWLDTEAALRGARPSPDPSAESPVEQRAGPGWELERAPRLPTARPPELGAPQPRGKQICGPSGSGNRLGKVAAQATLQICQGFLRKSRGPNLFQNKVQRRKQPHVLPVYHQHRCLKTQAQSRTRLFPTL